MTINIIFYIGGTCLQYSHRRVRNYQDSTKSKTKTNASLSSIVSKGEIKENLEDISREAFLQDPSHLSPPSPSPPLPAFSCYHKNCEFHTDDEREYRRHGALNHHKNPLLFPSKFEIEKYGLKPQGKNWEI